MDMQEELDDKAIDRALLTWSEEGDVAYAAHVYDYLARGMPQGPARDAAVAELKAADEQAWTKNRDLMRRAISAAFNQGEES